MILLAKTKLNTMEVLISKTLIDSNLSDDCISVNDIIEEFNDMKEAIKNLKKTNSDNKM